MRDREYSCGLDAALDVIGGKWKVLIMWPLREAPKRFGELRREVPGISEKMLIQQLKEMELDGVVTRHDYREVPPRVEYEITALGRELLTQILPLWRWIVENLPAFEAARAKPPHG